MKMSTTECASCGKSECDDMKLKNCTACYLVKYCSINCQRNHRAEHKRTCKKRAAELKDELLFKQPESADLGDCPICLLPFPNITPTDEGEVIYIVYDCCSKLVCDGCVQANSRREVEASLLPSCPFCRHHPLPTTEAEGYPLKMKRAAMNDPVAFHDLGVDHSKSGDIATAIKYFKKAAELGHAESHYQLSVFYIEGRGLEKDMKKFVYHLEQAAIGGHCVARHNLGAWEGRKGNDGRAVKHYTIAANLGFDVSLEALKKYYARGMVSREDFAAVIRQHQAALDATKSPQRHEAKMNRKVFGEYFQ